MGNEQKRSAFVYRIRPGGIDRIDEALQSNQLITGWAEAKGLLNDNLTWDEFREVVRSTYYTADDNLRRAGAAAGNLWRFIREMKPGDLVVVPHGNKFYVAEVTGDAIYDSSKVGEDSAYRRPVKWLNKKNPIPRSLARAALLMRMKTWSTSARAGDLIGEIEKCLELVENGQSPTFQSDLHTRLVKDTLDELREGRLSDRDFEDLLASLLKKLGAESAEVRARKKDKGADVLATFRIAEAFEIIVAVQAKHWGDNSPVGPGVVEQLIRGIEAEYARLGMVITSGTISEEAERAAEEYYENSGIGIVLIDGEQLAKLILEYGIPTS